jgi:hypothetical protein
MRAGLAPLSDFTISPQSFETSAGLHRTSWRSRHSRVPVSSNQRSPFNALLISSWLLTLDSLLLNGFDAMTVEKAGKQKTAKRQQTKSLSHS